MKINSCQASKADKNGMAAGTWKISRHFHNDQRETMVTQGFQLSSRLNEHPITKAQVRS